MEKSIKAIDKKSCNGCKVCGDCCPVKAISYHVNSEGFWYPYIDEKLCINCGECLKTCSAISKDNSAIFQKEVYASWNNNIHIRRESTSGGIYSAFAESMLKQEGYLVGCKYSDDYKSAFHICSNRKDDLDKIAGSKYFQSDTEGIYIETQNALQTGKPVLFVGTPCQVKALKNYLNRDYDNLITVDFICRGIPSPLVHKKKIELYEKKKRSTVICFRDKYDKYAWIHFGEQIVFQNSKKMFVSRWKDRIKDCFIKRNLNVRESCYQCPYKAGNNYSEITIGDFWGIRGVTEKDLTEGVSALIVNNELGRDFLQKIVNDRYIYTERRTLGEIERGNEAYTRAITRPAERDAFFDTLSEKGLDYASRKYAVKDEPGKVIRKRLFRMKHRRFLPIFKNWKQINWFLFFKYNYFSKQVTRQKDAFLIPCKGSEIQFSPQGKLELNACMYFNYYPYYKRAGRTALLRIEDGGKLIVNNDVEIAYDNTISIDRNAYVSLGHFYTNVGANLICKKKMIIGNNVMLARDVCIFDSDFHSIFGLNGELLNPDKEIVIEDNVWIGARSMVLKGAILRSGSIISANSMVMGETESNRVFINVRERKSVGDNVIWER